MPSKPLHVVLLNPVIPQNTGSIARLCACTGAVLHLIHPLGFQVDEASVKRAGLDYWEHVDIREHESWVSFLEKEKPINIFFFSKFAKRGYGETKYSSPAYLVFGNETQGLPQSLHSDYAKHFFQVPMRTHLVRSLNLAQCVAVVVYEALRQENFSALKA